MIVLIVEKNKNFTSSWMFCRMFSMTQNKFEYLLTHFNKILIFHCLKVVLSFSSIRVVRIVLSKKIHSSIWPQRSQRTTNTQNSKKCWNRWTNLSCFLWHFSSISSIAPFISFSLMSLLFHSEDRRSRFRWRSTWIVSSIEFGSWFDDVWTISYFSSCNTLTHVLPIIGRGNGIL